MWYYKAEEQTEFARSMNQVTNAVATAGLYTAGFVAVAALEAAIADNDDDCNNPPHRRDRRRRSRGR